jgi:hypothetical protein
VTVTEGERSVITIGNSSGETVLPMNDDVGVVCTRAISVIIGGGDEKGGLGARSQVSGVRRSVSDLLSDEWKDELTHGGTLMNEDSGGRRERWGKGEGKSRLAPALRSHT